MKNYFKRGLKGDYGFIVGYRKSYEIDAKGEKFATLEIYTSDGQKETFAYTPLLEINTLKKMREQFASIEVEKLRGKSLREYEKQKFFLENEAAINSALFTRAKRDGLYRGVKNVSPQALEDMHRLPIIEKQLATGIALGETSHMRVVNNAELVEKLDISYEELQAIKAQNPNPGMDNFSLLISFDRITEEEKEMGLASYGFDLVHYTKNEIISVLTGKYTAEEARERGMMLITKKDLADSLNMPANYVTYLELLRQDENIPEIPLITINDLENYSLEDLHAILDGSYAQEYNRSYSRNKNRAKVKSLSFKPLTERLFGFNRDSRVRYY